MKTFLEMPSDVLIEIATYLTAKELVESAQVNSVWRRLTNDNTCWKQKVRELAIISYEEQPRISWKQVYLEEYLKLKNLSKALYLILTTDDPELDIETDPCPAKKTIVDKMLNVVPAAITSPALLNTFIHVYPTNDINHQYLFGYTLLHWFIIYGDPDGVKYLIAKGAKTNKTEQGDTLLYLASSMYINTEDKKRYEETMRILVKKSPDLMNYENVEEIVGAFFLPDERELIPLISLFLELGANPAIFTNSGWTDSLIRDILDVTKNKVRP
jgi:Ankyrin repeats (3 copies)